MQRSKQNAATNRVRSYNGLMTYGDKKHVTKIQLMHLQTENPYLDDFYFEAFSKRDVDSVKQQLTLPKLKPLQFFKKGDAGKKIFLLSFFFLFFFFCFSSFLLFLPPVIFSPIPLEKQTNKKQK